MPDFASKDDGILARCIERWKQTAISEVDDIGGWRDAAETRPTCGDLSRQWGKLPNSFYGDTAYLGGVISTHYPKLDPSPLMDIHGAVAAWHADHNAGRIAPQNCLCDTLDRAVLTLQAIEAAVYSRLVPSPTPNAEPRPQDATAGKIPEADAGAGGNGEQPQDAGNGWTWQRVRDELEARRQRGDRYTSHEKLAKDIGCSKYLVTKAFKNGSAELQNWASAKHCGASRRNLTPEAAAVAFDNIPQAREPDPADIIEQADIERALAYLIEQAKPDERARIHGMTAAKKRELAELALRDHDTEEQSLRYGTKPSG